jgi:HK97 gp10 family phage protein
MAGINFERQFKDFHHEVMAVVRANMAAKLDEAGDLVRDTMKAECPVDTGDLKKSIRVRRDKKGQYIRVIAGDKKAWYIHLVLFGTSNRITKTGQDRGSTAPDNFMQRSIDQNLGKLKQILGEPIRDEKMPGAFLNIKQVTDGDNA